MNSASNFKYVKALAVLLTAGVFFNAGWEQTKVRSTPKFSQQEKPAEQTPKKLDPAGWGGNHVGQEVPEFVHGDECLFCHRNTIGATWQNNAHGVTVRHREDAVELRALLKDQPKLKDFAEEIEYFLGSRRHVRFLKKEGYGKFAVLDTQAALNAEHKVERWEAIEKPTWDKEKFANRCAGCHTTGVDPKSKTFSGFGLDCFTCHGVVDLDHSNDTSKVLLSKKRRNDAKVITSLCAQCHLRESLSRSTGLPYPNNFVAGDNLFQDLAVDWAKADDAKLNPGDRHIWRNVRDVAVNGDESITCVSCHQVHANTSIRHRRILRAPICSECHAADSFKNPKPYTVQSKLCEY
ncbi:MAG TPA: multiheme c-type cytochrome [Blastocatellia bacterium]|nr:multiheme c-type cytochrome [Blastocatellia bacterium]HMX25131.1 multiheme c-type cytochrome [Blastocatellia bacterium]HMY75581.1 multiheme c-type cytochrome [Blastocatellia bacterium]HMZ21399.1 multiheme c-type cytochrome [Blastocatellia bacterium]HNG32729.1 multiheme c-type cytochrome [Blastocatellia bacterium]